LATADEGDRPLISRHMDIDPWELLGHLRFLSEEPVQPMHRNIVDIDIDYFTHHDLDGPFGQVFSDAYIASVGESLQRGIESGSFGVVTIALSPSTTGSWQLAERIAARLLEPLGLAAAFASGAP